MTKKTLLVVLMFVMATVSGCAVLQPGYEKPVITISSVKAIPNKEVLPQFQIGLHIVNPNRSALTLKGISYTLTIEGYKVITGVSNKLPQIEAYGEGNVLLNASVDIFGSIKFFTDLMRNPEKDKLSYSLEAKLDAGTLYPVIRVSKKGTLTLGQPGFD